MSAQELYYKLARICVTDPDNEYKIKGGQIPLDYLRFKKKCEFWNLVYYFNEHALPFDLMLPYE